VEDSDVSKGFQLKEIRSPAPVGANPEHDPLVRRLFARQVRSASGPASSSSSRRTTKSADPIRNVRWAKPEEYFLQPNERHLSTMKVAKPVLLLVRANWTGTAQGLKLTAGLQGAPPVTGKVTRIPPDRGTVLLTTRIETPGRVEISTRNPDRTNGTSVQLIIGTMPLTAI
jgi:hypothetical protein